MNCSIWNSTEWNSKQVWYVLMAMTEPAHAIDRFVPAGIPSCPSNEPVPQHH